MKAIQFSQTGGPDTLRWADAEVAAPRGDEVRLRHTAVGVNFIDTYHRRGIYPVDLPSGLGVEAAGVVEQAGSESLFQAGDRVAYAGGPLGSYSEQRTISGDRLVKIPDDIEDDVAAAVLLKGLTAHYLVRRSHPIRAGECVLVHAAAGGVGLLLCQWAQHLGATVIGTVGTKEKAELAASHGCDHPILYTEEDFVARVRELTGGEGVAVVYDSVGKDTFFGSLDCLKRLGLMVTFGQSSGMAPPLAVHELTARGSLFLTRPTLADYTATREELEQNANELFEVVRTGVVRQRIGQRYPLADAAQAHADLEARRTTGAVVLQP